MKQVQKGIVRTDLDRDQSTGKYNLPETEICSQMRNIYYVVRKDYTNLDLQSEESTYYYRSLETETKNPTRNILRSARGLDEYRSTERTVYLLLQITRNSD